MLREAVVSQNAHLLLVSESHLGSMTMQFAVVRVDGPMGLDEGDRPGSFKFLPHFIEV